jgi:anti-anti-sigma regulatory factor
MTALAFTPVLAHLGHWYVSLPVFGGPVLAVVIFVMLSQRAERRRVRDGQTGHLRVAVANHDDSTVLSVEGALDYPTVLTGESEIEAAAHRTPRVLLDLSKVTSVEVDLAWALTEVIQAVKGAEVTVVVGSDPALRPLRDVCELEGIALSPGPVGEASGSRTSAEG